MAIDWNEVQKALVPMKDYDDLARRLRESFGYAFVRAAFNFDRIAKIVPVLVQEE